MIGVEAVGKRPSAAYFDVRLIPRDFGSLAYGHFPSASMKPVLRQSPRVALNVIASLF